MATDFIGSVVTVTLNQPPNAQVRGYVECITQGQRLDLKDVTWLTHGTHAASITIETSNIRDLNIEPDGSAIPPTDTPSQPLADPAILSFDRTAGIGKPPTTPIKHAANELTPPSSAEPTVPAETKPPEDVGATATLTQPFDDLTLHDAVFNDVTNDHEEETPAKAAARKRRRRRPTKSRKDDPQEPSVETSKSVRIAKHGNNGWGEPPFLHEPSSAKKPHPLDAPIRRAEQRLAQARKGRRQNHQEERNGWATEEVTDIQDMGDFDFQGNLSKFDKRGVFEQIRQDDTTADEARLVSFNRLPTRPGTNGGKNLHYTENVLDSPKANGHMSWNSEDDSEGSDDRFSSGRSSRRNLSRVSVRKPPSRKGSAIIPPDHASSSGFPPRYSSQEHLSPRIKVKSSNSRYPRSEISRPSSSLFQLASSGAYCPCVTPLQMLELEQLATSELGLSDDMMTENAARCIAQLACKATAGNRVVVLAGNTKSGARAIAAGRQMKNHGMRVILFVLGIEREEDLLEMVRRQLSIYRNSGGRLAKAENLLALGRDQKSPSDLIVDALLGMHLSFEDLRTADQNSFYEIAVWVNKSNASVMAVDVPSGLDASSGSISRPKSVPDLLIHPTHVLALSAPKTGLLAAIAQQEGEQRRLWKLFVADVGISNSVWKKFGTKRRHGVDFGAEWVAEIRFVAGST
ncbi:MAG: hypothetical protein Q9216_005940 [Gyalolechia sp. 2 TL-2023]